MTTQTTATFKRGDRVSLKLDACSFEYTDGWGIVTTVLEPAAGDEERGPLFEVYVGRGLGVFGMGYTRNYADELEPGWNAHAQALWNQRYQKGSEA